MSRWNSLLSLSMGVCCLCTATAAKAEESAPSFSCSGQLSSAEKIICEDPHLANMDVQTAKLFNDALHASGANEKKLRDSQRGFLGTRDSCGDDKYCIEDQYGYRISDLSHMVPSSHVANKCVVTVARKNPSCPEVAYTPDDCDKTIQGEPVRSKVLTPAQINIMKGGYAFYCAHGISCIPLDALSFSPECVFTPMARGKEDSEEYLEYIYVGDTAPSKVPGND